MNEEKKRTVIPWKLILVIFLVILVLAFLIFVLRPFFNENDSPVNPVGIDSVKYPLRDQSDESLYGLDNTFFRDEAISPWDSVTYSETYSYTLSISEFGKYKTYKVERDGVSYSVEGEELHIYSDGEKQYVTTPVYSIEYNNEEFDMYSELGIISPSILAERINEGDALITESSDGLEIYISLHSEDVAENYTVLRDSGIITSGVITYGDSIIKSFTVSDISAHVSIKD